MQVEATLKAKRKRKITSEQWFWGYVCIAPVAIGFLVFTLIPIIMSLYYSFTKYDGITQPIFIGIENYKVLLKDENFMISLKNTVVFTVLTVAGTTVISLFIANLLNKKIKGRTIFRSIFFIPYILSFVAAAMIWQWLFNTDYGAINDLLGKMGLYQPPWLTSKNWAMISVTIVSIWKGMGFSMILFLAGLQNIPRSYYEAAEIDGANGVQQFFNITVPLLKNTTLFVIVMSMISSFQAFDQIYLLTSGGPDRATQVVVYDIYMNAFQFFKQGYASAMSYILFLFIFITTLIQFRITNKSEKSTK